MNLVFVYKQTDDFSFSLLKLSVHLWKINFNPKHIFVIGEFDKKIKFAEPIKMELKYNSKISNINTQILKAYEIIKEPFIIGYNDIFPFKKINKNYLDLEHSIYNGPDNFWWVNQYKSSIEVLQKKFGEGEIKIYGGHNFYTFDEEKYDLFKDLIHYQTFNNLYTIYRQIKGKNDFYLENYIATTFKFNKFIWKETENTVGANITLPKKEKSLKILNTIIERSLNGIKFNSGTL